jgi:hypothetical protein
MSGSEGELKRRLLAIVGVYLTDSPTIEQMSWNNQMMYKTEPNEITEVLDEVKQDFPNEDNAKYNDDYDGLLWTQDVRFWKEKWFGT